MKHACLTFLAILLQAPLAQAAPALSIQGAPADTGYNVGDTATLRAVMKGTASSTSRYSVFADIQYAGTASAVSVEMDPQPGSPAGETRYEAVWPIPPDAPTGLYTVAFHIEDRAEHRTVARANGPGFVGYRKLVQIERVALDKTFYAPGERIQCGIAIQNLTDRDFDGLRVEFSNENYPWIATFSGAKNLSGSQPVNPELGQVVLRDALRLPARGEVTLPMQAAGTARFLQGTQVAVMGAGGPARHFAEPPPEVDRYTIAVWNHDRTELLDMQFSPQVIVRDPSRTLPKPYSRNFTHPYNQDIDFAGYREFYPPGYLSPAIRFDGGRTLYRPGESVALKATIPNLHGSVQLSVEGPDGEQVHSASWPDVPRSASGVFSPSGAWTIPDSAVPGAYRLVLTEGGNHAIEEIAVNQLPASLLVFCPHEDDEHPWAGLIRAMVEAGLPVHVVFFTGGDVGECERYFSKPCGPNEAREFGTVRMEESREALEHIGLTRDHVTFLGLPDGGSGEIWFHHIAPANPFLSIYLAVDHAPYENLYRPNLPYARDSVIDAVKSMITEFRPALIATPHPDERHVDHRTATWFVIKACDELLRDQRIDPATVILADQTYGSGGYQPAPYHYEKYVVYLSGEAAALKQEMGWIYQSQDGNLDEGSRKPYADLPRQEIHYRITDWQQHEGWNEAPQ